MQIHFPHQIFLEDLLYIQHFLYQVLAIKKQDLIKKQQDLQKSIDFIDWKQNFYSDVLEGKTAYVSNLIDFE